MTPPLFITGTDTNVGKTFVSIAVARACNAYYWKPIQSGEPRDSDSVSAIISSEFILPSVYSFVEPIAPHIAAKRMGIEMSVAAVLKHKPIIRPLIIEGAGGVCVPINKKETNLDLIQSLGAVALVVARTQLGTINHTLMTLNALDEAGIIVKGLVLTGPSNMETFEALEELTEVPLLTSLPLDVLHKAQWVDAEIKSRLEVF